jgi:hypothetical protein
VLLPIGHAAGHRCPARAYLLKSWGLTSALLERCALQRRLVLLRVCLFDCRSQPRQFSSGNNRPSKVLVGACIREGKQKWRASIKPCRQEWASGGLKTSAVKERPVVLFRDAVYVHVHVRQVQVHVSKHAADVSSAVVRCRLEASTILNGSTHSRRLLT